MKRDCCKSVYKGKSEPWKKVCTSDDWTIAILDYLGGRKGIIGEFRYATLGIQILAGIIERASREKCIDYANRNLFEPLGLPKRILPVKERERVRRSERNVHRGYDRPMRTGLQRLQARWPEPISVPDAVAQTTASRSFVRRDAALFCVKRERRTGIRSAMSARIFPAPTSWKRRPGTDRSTRSANPRWRICGSSGRRGWPLFLSASGSGGPVLSAEASSVSTQVCAAAAAGSTPFQRSTDAKRKIWMREIKFAKGNELHPKDCREAKRSG